MPAVPVITVLPVAALVVIRIAAPEGADVNVVFTVRGDRVRVWLGGLGAASSATSMGADTARPRPSSSATTVYVPGPNGPVSVNVPAASSTLPTTPADDLARTVPAAVPSTVPVIVRAVNVTWGTVIVSAVVSHRVSDVASLTLLDRERPRCRADRSVRRHDVGGREGALGDRDGRGPGGAGDGRATTGRRDPDRRVRRRRRERRGHGPCREGEGDTGAIGIGVGDRDVGLARPTPKDSATSVYVVATNGPLSVNVPVGEMSPTEPTTAPAAFVARTVPLVATAAPGATVTVPAIVRAVMVTSGTRVLSRSSPIAGSTGVAGTAAGEYPALLVNSKRYDHSGSSEAVNVEPLRAIGIGPGAPVPDGRATPVTDVAGGPDTLIDTVASFSTMTGSRSRARRPSRTRPPTPTSNVSERRVA